MNLLLPLPALSIHFHSMSFQCIVIFHKEAYFFQKPDTMLMWHKIAKNVIPLIYPFNYSLNKFMYKFKWSIGKLSHKIPGKQILNTILPDDRP